MKAIKYSAEFVVIGSYTIKEREDDVYVKLHVDYKNSIYSISPFKGNEDTFKFKNVYKPEEWEAVAKAILEANRIGQEEIRKHSEETNF